MSRGEMMNRFFVTRLAAVLMVLFMSFTVEILAQDTTAKPADDTAKAADAKSGAEKDDQNPFAPKPAPPLPKGMTGSDTSDPRYKLSPGLYDAGEAAMGIKHLTLVKKPGAFQLGTDDPADPKVGKTLDQLGVW